MSYVQTAENACDLMFAQHISGFVDWCRQQVKSSHCTCQFCCWWSWGCHYSDCGVVGAGKAGALS